MFGIGFTEILIIGVILIVAVGPERMPGLLKAVLRGYREFRKATRELRASTGIDEILQDEDLKSLRHPLYVPPAAKAAAIGAKPVGKHRALTDEERNAERPPEGVDIAEVRAAEREPDAEAEKRRAAKMAVAAREQDVIAAKEAAAQRRASGEANAEETDEERRVREKIAALEAERVRAKTMNAAPDDESEHQRIVNAKIAAAIEAGEDVPLPRETEEQRKRREAKEAAARSAEEK